MTMQLLVCLFTLVIQHHVQKTQAIPMITPLVLSFIIFGVHQQVQACGGVYNASYGSITSPSYPDQYPPNQDCVYIINAATGYRITLTFPRFKLANETLTCERDYLQIRDGGLSTSPFIGTYCGTKIYRRRSSSNIMWIKFHSDSSQSGAGFQAEYTTDIIPQKFSVITVSQFPSIFRSDIDTYTLINIPVDGLQDPGGIDYDHQTSRIYWSDRTQKTIRSANLNGSDVRLVRSFGPVSVPDGLCVDSLSRFIFYTDAGNKVIGMITMYSNTHRIVINSSLDMPKDIELDKRNGVIYWSDRGATPTIERANYDGTGRQTLVSGGEYLNQPNAIALDTVEGRLYWADGGTQKVGWVDLEGRKISLIQHQPGLVYYGIDLYLNDFFVTDWSFLNLSQWLKTRIFRYGKDGSNERNYFNRPSKLNDIRVYAEEMEDKGPNGCGSNNGGCSYICVPTPGNRNKCLTEDGGSTKSESPATGSSTKASDPSISSEAESVSTNTKIIIAVCVVAAVVGIAVIIALVIFFKLRRQSNPEEHGASTQIQNTSKVAQESLTLTSNALHSGIYDEIPSCQSGDRDGNSNNADDTSYEQPVRKKCSTYITPTGSDSNSPHQEEHQYDDWNSSH